MITKRIQVYNNTNIDPTLFLTGMFQYYQEHDVTFNYDIANTAIPVPPATLANNPLVGNIYVVQGAEKNLPVTDHDIALFFYPLDNWKAPWYWPWPLWNYGPAGQVPRDCTYMANGKPFITIGYWATDQTVQQRFIHEPMHALAKIFGCVDQMDTYINDNTPNSPVGNFATQWGIFKTYLNTIMKPTIQQSTINFVAGFEGFSATPYKDINAYAIGYGFDFLNNVAVTVNTPAMTVEQAKVILGEKLQAIGQFVNTTIHTVLNQNQFDAICDFVYNEGEGALLKSNLLKNLNTSSPVIEDNFVSWDEDHKSGNLAVDLVLLARRQKEYALFLTA